MATAIASTKRPDPDPNLQHYLRLALDRIEPDPDQPRKTFDQDKLAELADSIALHDVIVPIIVRPHPKKGDGWYMLIAGERRIRAAKIAGKKDIPAVIDETAYTAGELLERQLLENTRDDLTPLEEADTYAKLLKLPGYSMDLLITKTGKSKAHLYGRMKLLALAPFAKKSLQEGKLSVAISELIARIDPKLQEQCAKEVLGKIELDWEHGIEHEKIDDDTDRRHEERSPLSYDATRALIRRKYSTKLALAKFDPQDATLTKAGACTSCEHRSGNQPELPGVAGGKLDDLCTKPACFEEKTHASWKKAAAAAAERGLEVVSGKDARECFDYDGIKVRSGAPYVDLDTPLAYDLQKNPDKPKTFGELLGKHAAEIPRALVQDESGAPRELLDKRAAVAKLRELGKVDKPEKPEPKSSSSSSGLSYEEQRARDEKKRELAEAAVKRTLVQIFEATPKKEKELALWRWIAGRALGDIYDIEDVVEYRGLKKGKEVLDLVDKAKSVDDVRALLLQCFAAEAGMHAARAYASKEDKEDFAEICKLLGIDHDKSVVLAKEAAKAEQKADAAKEKKKPAKKGGK